jgi:predicted metalloprotease with PDZ domain
MSLNNQLADIFAGALRRRGLQRAFPGERVSYPGIGIISGSETTGRHRITAVIDGTPAQQAGLRGGDEIFAADGNAFPGFVDRTLIRQEDGLIPVGKANDRPVIRDSITSSSIAFDRMRRKRKFDEGSSGHDTLPVARR